MSSGRFFVLVGKKYFGGNMEVTQFLTLAVVLLILSRLAFLPNREITNYYLLIQETGESTENFIDRVRQLINIGWEPIGSSQQDYSGYLIQTMVQYDK